MQDEIDGFSPGTLVAHCRSSRMSLIVNVIVQIRLGTQLCDDLEVKAD